MGAKYVFNPLTGNLDTTDVVAFNGEVNLGTAAAPSVFFTGDTNTGIYSPGADQVALSTNGTGRVFVDASGNITQEASSPDLVIKDNQSYTTSDGPTLQFQGRGPNATNYNFGFVRGVSSGANNAGKLELGTNSAGVQGTAITILPGGNVGIGTSSPETALTVRGEIIGGSVSSINGTTLLKDLYVTGASLGTFGIERSTGSPVLTTNIKHNENASGYVSTNTLTAGKSALKLASTGLIYATASSSSVPVGDAVALTDKFAITNAGLVGIGTTSPTQRLQVTDGSLSNFYIAPGYGGGEGTTIGVGGGEYLAFNGAPFTTERMRIDSSGRLLVGTSSNSGGALLQVNGDRIRVATAKTPASASDTGTTGEICWDASYIYVCTATNTWKRAALSTW